MKIRIADDNDISEWNSYINNHNDSTPYNLFAWKKVVEDVYHHKSFYLIAENNNKVIGTFPLFHFHIPFGTDSLISLPYCDVGDVLADTTDARHGLLREALSLAATMSLKKLEIRCPVDRLYPADMPWSCTAQTDKVRMLLKLPDSSEELWKNFKSKLRSQIRKAEKNGLEFRWGTVEDVKDFYSVFSHNMHRLGSPVHSEAWIKAIVRQYKDNGRLGLVFYKNRLIGGGIILYTKHMVCIPWASTLKEFNQLAPAMLLYWNFLKFSADHGKKKFDFGRSTPGGGTYKFKKQWGSCSEQLFWYHCHSIAPPSTDKTRQKMASRRLLATIWSKLPFPIATYFGPKVRKYITL